MENQNNIKINRIISSILVFLIILMQTMVIPVPIANAETTYLSMSYSPNPVTSLNAGDTIYISIIANEEVRSIDGYIEYDMDVFDTVDTSTSGIQLAANWQMDDLSTDSNNKAAIMIGNSKGNVCPANTELIKIPFKLKKSATSATFKLSDMAVTLSVGSSSIPDIEITIEPAGHTITYLANAGTDNVSGLPSQGNKALNTPYVIDGGTAMQRVNYIFKEWNTKADGTGTSYPGGSQYTTDADLILYAQWKPAQTTLTVNPLGGTWVDENGQTYTSSTPKQGNVGATLTINNPTPPSGYSIRLNADGGTLPTGVSGQLRSTKSFTGWTCSIPANFNNGTKVYTYSDKSATLTANYKNDQLTLPTPTKPGATFDGWWTAKDGGMQRTTASQTSYIPTTDEILVAHWVTQKYTLTIDANGGTYSGTNPVQEEYGKTTTLSTPTGPSGYKVTLDYNGHGTNQTLTQENKFNNVWTIVSGTGTVSGSVYTFGTDDGVVRANYTAQPINIPDPADPVGYTFDGWYDRRTGGTQIQNTTAYNPQGDVTIYAHWKAKIYTVTLNPNGGTINGVTGNKQVTVTYGQTYDSSSDWPADSVVKKPGYDFDGWYNGNTKVEGTDIVNITRNTTLTAKWLGAEIEITLDANQGKFADNTTLKTAKVRNEGTYGTAVDVKPTREGYEFKGWYLDPTNENTKIEPSTTVNLQGPTTFKAKWEAKKGKLTVNANGGTWSGTKADGSTWNGSTYEEEYGTTIDIPNPTAPIGVQVTLDAGANATLNGTNSRTTTISLTKEFDHWDGTGKDNLTVGTGSSTYKFGDTIQTLTAVYKNGNITLPTPTKPGYTFKNWTDSNGNPITPDNIYNITTPTTLTATYEGNKIKINFNTDGGTPVNSITVKNGDQYGTLPTTTKTGYTQDGWYNDNGDRVDPTDIINSETDITLTTHWKIKTPTLKVDPDHGEWEGSTEPQPFTQNYNTTKQITSDPVLTNGGFTVTFDAEDGALDPNAQSTYQQTRQFEKWEVTSGDGTWNESTRTFTFGENDSTLTAKYIDGETTLPSATREGSTFSGWYTEDGTFAGNAGDTYSAKKDETLHAKYEWNKYTVTYKNDDGSVIDTEEVEYNKNAQKAGTTPTSTQTVQPGYEAVFTGWDDEIKLQNIKQDVEVTATYTVKPIEYTITYENTKDVANDENPKTYTIETSEENLQLKDLQNSGWYIFQGWFDGPEDTANKITSIDKTKLENITVYAHWLNDKLYLSSQKYKIGENDIDNYEDGDIYLDKVEPVTTVKDFISNCDTNGTITILNADGSQLKEDDLVYSGALLKDEKGDQVIHLTLIVMGDLNGDGYATLTDLVQLNLGGLLDIAPYSPLNEIKEKAADVSNNGKVSITDLVRLNQSSGLSKNGNTTLLNLPGKEKLTYTKPARNQ